MAEALHAKNGAVSDFEGGVRLTSSDRQDQLEPFGSLFQPDWRESEAQLTEKQAVLLMHDTLPQGVKKCPHFITKEISDYNQHTEIL